MFSIIIATHDSERALVPTLAALVPGATAGIVREVIVADGGSRDATEQVADIAGCRFFVASEPIGSRLSAAAARARADWLMFLTPGSVPGPTWIDAAIAFVQATGTASRAAVFGSAKESAFARLHRALGALPDPRQGLIIRKAFYQERGGHRGAEPERDLMRRIGRRRLGRLGATVTTAAI